MAEEKGINMDSSINDNTNILSNPDVINEEAITNEKKTKNQISSSAYAKNNCRFWVNNKLIDNSLIGFYFQVDSNEHKTLNIKIADHSWKCVCDATRTYITINPEHADHGFRLKIPQSILEKLPSVFEVEFTDEHNDNTYKSKVKNFEKIKKSLKYWVSDRLQDNKIVGYLFSTESKEHRTVIVKIGEHTFETKSNIHRGYISAFPEYADYGFCLAIPDEILEQLPSNFIVEISDKETDKKINKSIKNVKKQNKNEETNNKISICFICDENYINQVTTVINSIIANKKEKTFYNIYIIYNKKSEKDIDICISRSDVLVTIITKTDDLSQYHTFSEGAICVASSSALYKFFLCDILKDLDKVLYLDADIIVNASLDELFNTDISDYFLAAVIDSGTIYYKHDFVKKVDKYFNSGVMLLNLSKMREAHVSKILLEKKQELNDQNLMDQNIFNVVFDRKFLQLPIKYNFMLSSLYKAYDKWNIDDINRVYNTKYLNKKQLLDDAVIFHYSAKDKPWESPNNNFAYFWYYYAHNNELTKKIYSQNCSNNIKISVIIPCYNVESYIYDTIGSIEDQTIKEIEIICLDDGSTDNTLNILKSLGNYHHNLKIISDSNHGQGYQRNRGIEKACGKYIYFMDSDDILEKTALEKLWFVSELLDLDVVYFEGESFYENDELKEKFKQYKNVYNRKNFYAKKFSGKKLFCNFIDRYEFNVSPCMQFSRLEYIKENNIRFPEWRCLEDNIYSLNSLINAKNVVCLPSIFYRRRVRNSSTMTSLSQADRIYPLTEILDYTKMSIVNSDNYNVQLKLNDLYLRYGNQLKDALKTLNEEEYSLMYNKLKYKNKKILTEYLIKNKFENKQLKQYNNNNTNKHFDIPNIFYKYLTLRVDIKNFGNKENCVYLTDISDSFVKIQQPKWCVDEYGSGYVLYSNERRLFFTVKCKNDGLLKITFRGVDQGKSEDNNSDINIYCAFINNEKFINETTRINHNKIRQYSRKVKDKDVYILYVEWGLFIDKVHTQMSVSAQRNEIEMLRKEIDELKNMILNSNKI